MVRNGMRYSLPGYGWRDLGMELRGAVYHEYSSKAGSSGVLPEGNLFRLALTKAF